MCSWVWICAPLAKPGFPIPDLKTHSPRRTKRSLEKTLAKRHARKYVLRLFVAGATARSTRAVLRVRQLCAAELKDNCTLEVIDIYQQPALARKYQIVATPTLIKEYPRPIRRFIGNLLNTAGLFAELEYHAEVNFAG